MSTEFKRTEHPDVIVHWTGKDIDAEDDNMKISKNVTWRKFCLRFRQELPAVSAAGLNWRGAKRQGLW